VHPMRKDAIEEFLTKANLSWNAINNLIENETIKTVGYNNNSYYIKNINTLLNHEK
jgi:hypothetical protein